MACCSFALLSTGCALYVSEREGVASDGGVDSGGSHDSGANSDGAIAAGDGGGGGDAGPACHPEDSACGYRFKRELTFNATALGEVLIDFPVLVTLNDERIDYAKTQAGGADLRFVDDDGTLLSHEIEQWQPGGDSAIWVRIPRFDPRTRKTISYFYGSSTTKVPSRGADVFRADYEAVYHLSDSLDAARVVRDALGQHDGVASAALSASANVAGRIGGGLTLSGAGQFVELSGLPSASITALTVELWVQPSAVPTECRLICRDSAANAAEPVACLGLQDGHSEMQLTTTGTGGRYGSAVGRREIGSDWTHISLVWDGDQQSVLIYANGMEDFSSPTMGKILADSVMPWILGESTAAGSGFSGIVDEVRISRVARSYFWMLATYVAATEAVASYGPEQAL